MSNTKPITEHYQLTEQQSPIPLFDQEEVVKHTKRKVAGTSVEAYHRIEAKIPDKQRAVLKAIGAFKHGATCEDVVKYLGWPINRVSGRITDLKRAGHIRVIRKHNGFQVYEATTVNV